MALLNITNFDDHPEDTGWIVFRFPTAGQAQEFVQELEGARLKYERDESGGPPFLIGVKQHHREQAVRLNYLVLGRHRAPFMADRTLRWIVLGAVALFLLLALGGMLFGTPIR